MKDENEDKTVCFSSRFRKHHKKFLLRPRDHPFARSALPPPTKSSPKYPEFSASGLVQRSLLLQQQRLPPQASQGAWGTPGRGSAADFLRCTAAATTTTTTGPQPSAPTSSQLASATGLSTAAAGLVAVPLSAESVGAMVGMGIEEEWAAAALRRCGGADVSRAVEFCFSNDIKALAEKDARTLEVGVDWS